MKILLVEDNVSLCRNIASVLQNEGYTVVTCSNGNEAEFQMLNNSSDLVTNINLLLHNANQMFSENNIEHLSNTLANPGRLVFQRDGQSYALEAVANADGSLLVMMADGTSGHGSYAAGRYLDVAAPDAQGQTLLDFNRSYNPPCAFSIYATCPLPPAENRLGLRIEAGEKAYAHKPVAGQEV